MLKYEVLLFNLYTCAIHMNNMTSEDLNEPMLFYALHSCETGVDIQNSGLFVMCFLH